MMLMTKLFIQKGYSRTDLLKFGISPMVVIDGNLDIASGDMIKKVVDILGYQWHELTKEVGD